MGKILFSGFRFSHHNAGSGYDGLVDCRSDFVYGNDLPLGCHPEDSFLRKFNYFLVDALTLIRGFRYPAVHYLYPEHTAYLSALILKCLRKTIIFTIHLDDKVWLTTPRTPFRWLKQQNLKCADIIITLSTQQALIVKKHFKNKDVHFIPHGLDMDAALPDNEVLRKRFVQLKVVVVGSNYRDFDMLDNIIKNTSSRSVTFHLVGLNKKARARFSGVPGVVCYDRLDSSEYESLLKTSLMLALPLTFATANNALLEAHKNYLPSACSDIPGIRDYATADTFLFSTPADFWDAFDRLVGLDFQAYREVCMRTHAEGRARFGWEYIRQQVVEACENLSE